MRNAWAIFFNEANVIFTLKISTFSLPLIFKPVKIFLWNIGKLIWRNYSGFISITFQERHVSKSSVLQFNSPWAFIVYEIKPMDAIAIFVTSIFYILWIIISKNQSLVISIQIEREHRNIRLQDKWLPFIIFQA